MYCLDWPYAYGKPSSHALFKAIPEDFEVHEFFDGPFSGKGEHILLHIEKKGLTTEEVVKAIATLINKSVKWISYAGLKDKQSLSTQWINVHAPGEEIPEIESLSGPGWRVLSSTRHHKKIKPGFLSGNRFVVRLREVSSRIELERRMALIQEHGVPNYFGEQRFGREGANLLKAEAMLVQGRKVKDRFLKGMYFSSARSWLFNLILSKRVQENSWKTPLSGDVMQLSGTNSIFYADDKSDVLQQRILARDISPASPLAGKSRHKVSHEALALIESVYEQWPIWVESLKKAGLEEAWRANIVYANDLHYEINGDEVTLTFSLPAGSYATTVLRELVQYA